jgi:CIC family chloride channel protein
MGRMLEAIRNVRLPQIPVPQTGRLIAFSVLIGVVGGLGAQLFIWMLSVANGLFLHGIAGYLPPGIPSEGGSAEQVVGPHGRWLIPICTTLGGLLSGLIVFRFAPEAEGHGTDSAVRAFHHQNGAIRGRVPLIKAIASAITIGSGGSAGREGPGAQISAGFGSVLAEWFSCSPTERRWLMLVGVAAGLAAIFRSPLGSAIFAVEVLYGSMEFEARALLFTMIGAITGYAVNGFFVGYEPIFLVDRAATFHRTGELWWYAILGIVTGIAASFVPYVFYKARELFRKLPGPRLLQPALGGLMVGVLGLALPQILGGGYGWMQRAINGEFPLYLLLVLAVAKLFAMSFTVSSGGSGGVFAPSMYVGTCLGAAMATAVNLIFPHEALSVPAFAVVGMAALFSGAARVPMATMFMVVEMTGGYGLMVPAMLAVTMSYMVQYSLTRGRRYKSLYEAQVATVGDSPVHHEEYVNKVLDLINAGRARMPREATPIRLEQLLMMGRPIPVSGTGRSIVLARVRNGAPASGVPLKDRPFGGEISLITILRGDKQVTPGPNVAVQDGDRLIVMLNPEGYDAASDSLELIGPVQ